MEATNEVKEAVVSNGLITTVEKLIESYKSGRINEREFIRLNRELMTVAEDMLDAILGLCKGD